MIVGFREGTALPEKAFSGPIVAIAMFPTIVSYLLRKLGHIRL